MELGDVVEVAECRRIKASMATGFSPSWAQAKRTRDA